MQKKSFDLSGAASSLATIEQELWKKNILRDRPRQNKDYLDVAGEDFARNRSVGIDGTEITPSSKLTTLLSRYYCRLQHIQGFPETD